MNCKWNIARYRKYKIKETHLYNIKVYVINYDVCLISKVVEHKSYKKSIVDISINSLLERFIYEFFNKITSICKLEGQWLWFDLGLDRLLTELALSKKSFVITCLVKLPFYKRGNNIVLYKHYTLLDF